MQIPHHPWSHGILSLLIVTTVGLFLMGALNLRAQTPAFSMPDGMNPECADLMQKVRSLGPDSDGFDALKDRLMQSCMPTKPAAPETEQKAREEKMSSSSQPQAQPKADPAPVRKSESLQEITCEKKMSGTCTILRCSDGTSWNSCMCSIPEKPMAKSSSTSRRIRTKKPAISVPNPKSVTTASCPTATVIQQSVEACDGFYIVKAGDDGCESVQCIENISSGFWCLDHQAVYSQEDLDEIHKTCTQLGGIGELFDSANLSESSCPKYTCVKQNVVYGQNTCSISLFYDKGGPPACWTVECGQDPETAFSSTIICDTPVTEYDTVLPCKITGKDTNGCTVQQCADGTTAIVECPKEKKKSIWN